MKYTFVVEAPISLHIDVTAASLPEAVEKALTAPVMSLCHQCARGEKGSWSTSGELDSDPTSCSIVELFREDDDGVESLDLEEVTKLWGA